LRERLQDIPLLVEDFLSQVANESTMGRKKIDLQVHALLQSYHWPGNIRELRNFVERLVIMTPGQIIRAEDLPGDFQRNLTAAPTSGDPYRLSSLKEARAVFEREYLVRKLEEYSWNISLTAQQIGIERSHLHRKMKALGIRELAETSEQAARVTAH
jgi:two-component system nitrogen regulation response regulator NtrX